MSMPLIIDQIIIKFFNILRKMYNIFAKQTELKIPNSIDTPKEVNSIIFNLLNSQKPCMIGRFGYYELECTVFANNRLYHKYDLWNYMRSKSDIWLYPTELVKKMKYNAGFFTPSYEMLDRFGNEMISAMAELDVLGSWKKEESLFLSNLKNAIFVNLELLNPLWGSDDIPWSMALEGKNVLVVHPFSETIKAQYERRTFIHKDTRILPEFNLLTIKAVQSITGMKPEGFNNWFDALQYMKDEIDKKTYDICIIGCGAYGFLLAAHCKSRGKKAIHLGGATQLLFGIKGKRWEDPNYGFNGKNYLTFFTSAWIRPLEEETPKRSSDIEGGCYW